MKVYSQLAKNLFNTKKHKTTFLNLKRINSFGFSVYHDLPPKKSTTILAVRKQNELVMIGDGQVSQGNLLVKGNVNKLRVLNFVPEFEESPTNNPTGKPRHTDFSIIIWV